MSHTWYTSDPHYSHANIIGFCDRPFSDVTDMREQLISNWNSVVEPGDQVFCLGDFCFGKEDEAIRIAKRLVGTKHLIFGNHDEGLRRSKEFASCWASTSDLKHVTVEGQRVVLCHYPMLSWRKSHGGAWNLHGHCHGSLPDDPGALRLDVGVDCWDYYPASHEEVAKKMAAKTFRAVDHHGKAD